MRAQLRIRRTCYRGEVCAGLFTLCRAWWCAFVCLLLLQKGDAGDGIANASRETTQASDTKRWEEDAIILAILSDRVDGIVVAVSSVARHAAATSSIHVILVAPLEIRSVVTQKLRSHVSSITGLSLAEASADLRQHGIRPMWEWDSYNVSAKDFASWRTTSTIHVASWDYLLTHIHPLNHLRFYLPQLTIFQEARSFFFLDDDVLIQKDLGMLLRRFDEANDNIRQKPLLSMCSVWEWSQKCSQFEFLDRKSRILESTVLYGRNVPICRHYTTSEMTEENYVEQKNCVPQSYPSFLNSLPWSLNHNTQLSWNFGVSLFNVKAWRAKQMTQRYENMLRLNYRHRVFPETSLAFGLGVPYLAFAGEVACLEDLDFHVLDGLGTIGWPLFEAQSVNESAAIARLKSAGALHWSGGRKPWDVPRRVDPRFTRNWDREAYSMGVLSKKGMETYLEAQSESNEAPRAFLFLTAPRSGSEWAMSLLDQHPYVCASGEADNPDTGFPREALMPNAATYPRLAHANLNDCALKKGCTWGFFSHHVWILSRDDEMQRRRCHETYDPVAEGDPIAMHLPRLCNAVKLLLDRDRSRRIDLKDEASWGAVRRGSGWRGLAPTLMPSQKKFDKQRRRGRGGARFWSLANANRVSENASTRTTEDLFCKYGVASEMIPPSPSNDALRVCCNAACMYCGLAVGQKEERLGPQDCRRRSGGAAACCVRKILKHGGRSCDLKNSSGDVGCYMRIADMQRLESENHHPSSSLSSARKVAASRETQYDEWGVAINPATTIQRIFELYIDSLIRNVEGKTHYGRQDHALRFLLPCTCPPASKVIGFKAMEDWFGHPWVKHSSAWRGGYFNAELASAGGQDRNELREQGNKLHFDADRFPKVIHFTRWNVLERIVSMEIAKISQVWHIRTDEDRQKLAHIKVNIPPTKIVDSLNRQESSNFHAKRLLAQWGSEVYQVDYDTCRRDLGGCYADMIRFLGLPPNLMNVMELKAHTSKSFTTDEEGKDDFLSRLANRNEIEEALMLHGYHHLLGKDPPDPTRALDCRRGIIGNSTIIPESSNRAQGFYVCCAKACNVCGMPDRGCMHRSGGAGQCCVRNIVGNNRDILTNPLVQLPPLTRRQDEGRMCRSVDDVGCVVWRYLDNCPDNSCPELKPQKIERGGGVLSEDTRDIALYGRGLGRNIEEAKIWRSNVH